MIASIPDICPLSYLWFQRRIFLKFSSRKSIFSLCDLNHLNKCKEGHIRTIHPTSSLRGDSFEAIVDDTQLMITIAHIESLHQVSQKVG